ncbi:hypothetical protein MNBD_ALPHA03-2012 [hydrothermal vent metagenome]|uniref:Uncharacterized protein n=1 Tax=hydrothermal vent metagenome TaxID=652676 RepID=A0A3B1AFD8_9ZZZZ
MRKISDLTETSYPKRFFLSRERIQATGLALWFAAVTIPLWSLENPHSSQFLEEANLWRYPMTAILLVGIFLVLFRSYAAGRVAALFSTDIVSILLVSFGLFTIIVSLLTARWSAVAYSVMYLLAFWLWADFWQMSAVARRIFAIRTFYVLVLFLLGAVVIHGLPQYRWVGGIHPNHYGAVALALLIVARLCGATYYRVGGVLAFAATILVSSRYALLSCFAFVLVIYVLPLIRARSGGLRILLFGVCLSFAVVAVLTIEPLWNIFDWLFALSSVERGIGSNLTGRIDSWYNFSVQFFQEPILGYGFRQRHMYLGTHNAYLNMILENGLVAGLFLGGMVLTGGRMLNASLTSDKRWCLYFSDRSRREYVSDFGFAVFVVLTISGFFQPQLINFGDSFGILVFLMLGMNSYPVGSYNKVYAISSAACSNQNKRVVNP